MYFTGFIYIENIFLSNLQLNFNFDNLAKTRYKLTKCHGHVSEIVLSWSNHFEMAIKDRVGGLVMKLYFYENEACILKSTTASKIVEVNEWSKIIFLNGNHFIFSGQCTHCADDFFLLFWEFEMIALQIWYSNCFRPRKIAIILRLDCINASTEVLRPAELGHQIWLTQNPLYRIIYTVLESVRFKKTLWFSDSQKISLFSWTSKSLKSLGIDKYSNIMNDNCRKKVLIFNSRLIITELKNFINFIWVGIWTRVILFLESSWLMWYEYAEFRDYTITLS